MKISIYCFAFFLTISNFGYAAEGESIGIVKKLTGAVTLTHQSEKSTPAVGSEIHLNDLVETGGDGSIGISLKDSTTLSLGEDSELVVDDFVYNPAANDVSLGVNMLSGTMSYISGRIASISPDKITVNTPVMTIGIRGTKFLIKVEDQGGEDK